MDAMSIHCYQVKKAAILTKNVMIHGGCSVLSNSQTPSLQKSEVRTHEAVAPGAKSVTPQYVAPGATIPKSPVTGRVAPSVLPS